MRIDPSQAAMVGALAGDGQLIVVEGAAGAGKTTALRTTQEVLSRHPLLPLGLYRSRAFALTNVVSLAMNFGVEGPTNDPAVRQARVQQADLHAG